jgi:hypothetical protein
MAPPAASQAAKKGRVQQQLLVQTQRQVHLAVAMEGAEDDGWQ